MSACLRFSLELVENPLSLDTAAPSNTWLDNVDHRDVWLDEYLFNLENESHLWSISPLIGQFF